MVANTYIPEGQSAPQSQIGATLEALSATIAARRSAGNESYTYRLLNGDVDEVLKKVMEEAGEVALAAKDAEATIRAVARHANMPGMGQEQLAALSSRVGSACDHVRYEAADVLYHLLVVLERFEIGIDEFAAELNTRMTADERPQGALLLEGSSVNRGK